MSSGIINKNGQHISEEGVLQLYTGGGGNVRIDDSVREIGTAVFHDLAGLETVIFPSGLGKIGSRCFENCSGLDSIYLPADLRALGDYAFSGCTKLEKLRLSPGLRKISPYAFKGCTSLESVEIPAGISEIETGAFMNCKNLKSVTIPAAVTELVDIFGQHPFLGCRGLTIITEPGSAAEEFAKKYNIPFKYIDVSADATKAADAAARATENYMKSRTSSFEFEELRPVNARGHFKSSNMSEEAPAEESRAGGEARALEQRTEDSPDGRAEGSGEAAAAGREEKKRAAERDREAAERKRADEKAREQAEKRRAAIEAKEQAKKKKAEEKERKRAEKIKAAASGAEDRSEKKAGKGSGDPVKNAKALKTAAAILILLLIASAAFYFINKGKDTSGGSSGSQDQSGQSEQTEQTEDADYVATLEDFVKYNDQAREQIEESVEGTNLQVSISGNTLSYTYDLSTSSGISEDTAGSDEVKAAIEQSLDANDENLTELCSSLEADTGIKGISIEVIYTYGDTAITSRTYTAEGRQ